MWQEHWLYIIVFGFLYTIFCHTWIFLSLYLRWCDWLEPTPGSFKIGVQIWACLLGRSLRKLGLAWLSCPRLSFELEPTVDAEVWVIQHWVTIHANLFIWDDILLFPAKSNSRKECVLIYVRSDLIQYLVGHCCYGLLFVILVLKEGDHLIAQCGCEVNWSQSRLHEIPVEAVPQNKFIAEPYI